MLQDGRTTAKRIVKPGMDLVNVKLALDDIYLMLVSVIDYVDKVIVSRILNLPLHSILCPQTKQILFFYFKGRQNQHGLERGSELDEDYRRYTHS